MITSAFINIWNKRVGAIAWNEASELAFFEFEPSFLANEWDLSPLKMPIADASKRIFSFPELRRTTTFKGLPGLLADVLPDKYGNSLINAWLSRNGRPSDSMNPVELLCFIGKRGMGALDFEPIIPKTNNAATKIELESLINIAQEILSGKQDFNTSLSSDEAKALSDMLKIGSSAGGARAKAVIAFNPDTNEIRSGQADAPKGFSHWLLKFDGVSDLQLGTASGYGRIEMAYHLMAKEAEIEMTECRLLEENGRAHFMTQRFDRENGKDKLHTQSFCAIAHYDFNEVASFSYEQLFETMRRLLLPYTDAEQLYRRMVFNVMARNCDDHTKNFAFIMHKTGEWKLAPAFDICHSYRPGSIWVSQHSLSINGKRQNITREDLLEVAKNMNIKKASAIINQVNDVVSRWNDFAVQTNVKGELRDAIANTLLLL
ncbi:MAG: type II toxin-antitoxin system HipA family toxin [Sediminibacterium sp.]|nr:MAG: serine/threonine-protein kinase [Chitinophagaceae bacterium]MDP1843039.1 type II toxin-antitoxin system HipA family toxin [Sediminibacterium sp.]